MPQPQLKPIEERDPYAAMVLDAFDRMESYTMGSLTLALSHNSQEDNTYETRTRKRHARDGHNNQPERTMNTDQQRIAIAEACGWAGVPCEQQWRLSQDDVKYWRSVTPVEILDELKRDDFGSMMIARWLRMPNGKPFILSRQAAGKINNYMTYRDKPVLQGFYESSEWGNAASYGWKFQTDAWPIVEPSLVPFVEHLPDYLNDLNAMHEAENQLDTSTDQNTTGSYAAYAECLAWDGGYSATAAQRAEAFLRTINKWTTNPNEL
jgi:hypothetical protein